MGGDAEDLLDLCLVLQRGGSVLTGASLATASSAERTTVTS